MPAHGEPPLGLRGAVSAQGRHQVVVETDGPVAVRFGVADHELPVDIGHGLGDERGAAVEVDVCPPQPDDLATPAAGQRGERDRLGVLAAVDVIEERSELVPRPRPPNGGMVRPTKRHAWRSMSANRSATPARQQA
ncbi:MAG: hypothetical protein QM733_19915 [Ilumatobacteraceae bacterium]